jgi:hypothetical protein
MKRMLTVFACAVVVIAAAAGAVYAQQAQFTLTGLVFVEGGGRAWLQEPVLTQNQPVALRPGESIGPYRLTKIYDDRVELAGPGGAITVMLAGVQGPAVAMPVTPQPVAPLPPSNDPNHRVLPLGPPLAELPPGTPRVDFGELLRGVFPQ